MYKALHDDVTIKKSSIHGMGIFAIKDISQDIVLGISHVKDKDNTGRYHRGYIRTPLGGFINHSTQPNCIKVIPRLKLSPRHWPTIKEGEETSSMAIRTNRDIKEGEELTVSYTLYKID